MGSAKDSSFFILGMVTLCVTLLTS